MVGVSENPETAVPKEHFVLFFVEATLVKYKAVF